MASHRLTIRLSGPDSRDGAVELADFARICQSVAKALESVEEVVSGHPGATAFEVHDMRPGSAVVVVDAVKKPNNIDYRRQIMSTFRRAVDELNDGEISGDLISLNIEPFREMAQVLRSTGGSLRIGRVKLTESFSETLERVVPKAITSHGSVTGLLDRVNVHDRNELSLYPPDSGKQVMCRFPDELLEAVREGLKRTVTVSGELQYTSGEPFPKRCNVEKLIVHPDADDLPTLFDVRDLGAWGTDGLSAIDFVRAIRDE